MHCPPHILYIITRSEQAGAQIHLLELILGLKSAYRISVAAGELGFLTNECTKLRIPVYHLPSLKREINLARDYKSYIEFKSILSKVKPDLIHAHSSKAGVIGRLAAYSASIPSVFTAHGWSFAEGIKLRARILGFLCEKSVAPITNKIITVSTTDKHLALRYRVVNPKKIVTIFNGIRDSGFPKKKTASVSDTIKIICIARLSPQKNIKCLLRAISTLKYKNLCKVIIIGDGPSRSELVNYTKFLTLEGRVSFLGHISEVNKHLAFSDIFILSSDWEGLPVSIIEALRAGLPIVSTNVGGVPDLVTNGYNGFLSPRKDHIRLAENLDILINDKKRRNDMGKNSRKVYLKYFSHENMLALTDAVYKEVIFS